MVSQAPDGNNPAKIPEVKASLFSNSQEVKKRRSENKDIAFLASPHAMTQFVYKRTLFGFASSLNILQMVMNHDSKFLKVVYIPLMQLFSRFHNRSP